MTVFEMVFNLIGLVLGLSLVVVLTGLAKTLNARESRRIGWLTPLLGLWLILDVSAFWGLAFEIRDLLTQIWPSLLGGVILSSVYYLAASLVFPDDPQEQDDLDAHYWRTKKWVIGLVFACDVAAFVAAQLLGRHPSTFAIALNSAYALSAIGAFFSRGKRANIGLLGLLTAIMAAGFLTP